MEFVRSVVSGINFLIKIIKNKKNRQLLGCLFLMGERGVEPPRVLPHMVLSHACLPVPPLARVRTNPLHSKPAL